MEKQFQPISIDRLGRWIFDGLEGDEVMGLPRSSLRFPDDRMRTVCLDQDLGIPLGVAAGPHTQLANNIVAAWLCGARFIELKTVQILDEISVSRPCIDSADVTYNCEWSQELTLEQSFDEYLAAWVLIHALGHHFGHRPDVFFNMSVGYDLEGIRSPKVQRFLSRMRDAKSEMGNMIDALAGVVPFVRDIEIPTSLSNLVTLSTMHGCPPAEIEKIGKYMLEDLGIDTWVKLNPTLLGPERLRGILNDTMRYDIVVEDSAFEHDPKFDDAMKMIRNLDEAAKKCGRRFGVKLSNTLEVSNRRTVFPPKEKSMYMSGRALHPLTVGLAHLVTEAVDGKIPLSFCGGADAFNFPTLIADGLGPVTTCTDLLKPGGYARLSQYVDCLASALDGASARTIDELILSRAGGSSGMSVSGAARKNLAQHAERVLGDRNLRQRIQPLETKGKRELGYFDCIAAPCQEACPTHQNIPDYLRFVALNQPTESLGLILHTNAMPAITGRVCDHPCMQVCVRNHYESPLAIRGIKRYAEAHAGPIAVETAEKQDIRVAIVGAGPAGLSAAYYLSKGGCCVEILEAKDGPGGMASGVIPSYRLPDEPIEQDIVRIEQAGVKVRYGVRVGRDTTLEKLRKEGFENVILAAGAQKGRTLGIEGEDAEGVLDCLDFLDDVRKGKDPKIGPNVLVIGGGNSAMDAARTALRMVGEEGKVTVVYRRTLWQMPADPHEIESALDEGVVLQELRAPVKVVSRDGKVAQLVCLEMKLGEKDQSGRPRPIPIEGSDFSMDCQTIIVGISQEPILDFLGSDEPKMWKDGTLIVDSETCESSIPGLFAGGDLARGPSTVIQAIADGRRIAETIMTRARLALEPEPATPATFTKTQLMERRALRIPLVSENEIPMQARRSFQEVIGPYSKEQALSEADRCLACHTMCSLCVTVCPNRANQMYVMEPFRAEVPSLVVKEGELVVDGIQSFGVEQIYQIINIADLCNECGNCTTFCPTSGAPFRDKPRIHLTQEGYEKAWYDAWRIVEEEGGVQVLARIDSVEHSLWISEKGVRYEGQGVSVLFDEDTFGMVEAEAMKDLLEGSRIDLRVAAQMMVVAKSRSVMVH